MLLIDRITSTEFQRCIDDLVADRPDLEALLYIVGPQKMREWAHCIGASTESALREASPPIPPLELRSRVAASSEAVFLWTGLVDAALVTDLYKQFAVPVAQPKYLDFGCGCGRMTRFLSQDPSLVVTGTDVNEALVSWCRQNLPNVESHCNPTRPPSALPAEGFDFIYSLSIFTHLPEAVALDWLREILRLLKPGGTAAVTTHGLTALDVIGNSAPHQAMFGLDPDGVRNVRTELASSGFQYLRYTQNVIEWADAGDDYGNSFTASEYIYREWPTTGFEIVEFLPGRLRGWQDVTILRKPSRAA